MQSGHRAAGRATFLRTVRLTFGPSFRSSHYRSMHADEVSQPFHRHGWVYEEKYDGWRMAAYKDGDRVRLTRLSRQGLTTHGRFPGTVAALRSLDAGSGVISSAH